MEGNLAVFILLLVQGKYRCRFYRADCLESIFGYKTAWPQKLVVTKALMYMSY